MYKKIALLFVIISLFFISNFNSINATNTSENIDVYSNSTLITEEDIEEDIETYNTTSANVTNTSFTNTEQPQSAFVSTVNSLPESNLGLSNILNILLIVVGVLLILLSIAILTRLK